MANAVEKITNMGNDSVILSERGASFGYQNLVVDMRSFPILRKTGCPVVFDVTHSVQLPGGEGKSSGGQPEFIEPLARAGTAVGCGRNPFSKFMKTPRKPFRMEPTLCRWPNCPPCSGNSHNCLAGPRLELAVSLDTARRVLRIEAEALGELLLRLDASFEQAVELLLACKGRVVVTGMGKSGLIGRKIAATFSSTGTRPRFCIPRRPSTAI